MMQRIEPRRTPFLVFCCYIPLLTLSQDFGVFIQGSEPKEALIEMDFDLESLWYCDFGVVNAYHFSLNETFYVPTIINRDPEISNPNILVDQLDDEILHDDLVQGCQPIEFSGGTSDHPIVDESAITPQSKPATQGQESFYCPICPKSFRKKYGMMRHLQNRLWHFP
jgi:hypothetical protein